MLGSSRMAARPVYVRLHSGLGNQLFQIAAGSHFAAEQGRELILLGSADVKATLRLLLGDEVRVVARQHIVLAPYSNASSMTGAVLRRAGAMLPRPISTVVRQRPAQSGDERGGLPRTRQRPVVMDGYFQHETWVAEPDELGSKIARHLTVSHTAEVAIHLRRGDFLRLGQGLPVGYYERAMDKIGTGEEVVVVSDDELAAEGLAAHLQRLGVAARPSLEASVAEDFALLAGSRHLIMSNSTFSWWAAVVGDNLHGGSNRTVVCPQPWWFDRRSAPWAQRWQVLQWK